MEPTLPFAIELPDRSSRQLIRSLHRQMQAAILEGRLHPGMRLPPSRTLAAKLGISRNAVLAVYGTLLNQGYVTARGGAGTFVTSSIRSRPPSRRPNARPRDPRLVPTWHSPAPEVAENREPRYDFRIGVPDAALLPFDAWRRLHLRALRALCRTPGKYYDPQGSSALREALCTHASVTRAVSATADDIIVTAGAQQAFDLIAKILIHPKQTVVAVEDPGYPPARQAFLAMGARLIGVPVDTEGLVVGKIPAEARVVVTTPSHQFPLGMAMSLSRRLALLDFARKTSAVIIEDDYDGEFRFASRPLDALQTLDRGRSVFYVGTFSKSLFPGLRMGFAVVPPWARDAAVAAKRATDWHCPILIQETLARFIAEGHLARHLRKMRRVYGERRELLLSATSRFCDEHLIPYPSDTGLHTAFRLIPPLSSAALARQAADRSMALQRLDPFGLTSGFAGIALGIGAIQSNIIDAAVRELAAACVASIAGAL